MVLIYRRAGVKRFAARKLRQSVADGINQLESSALAFQSAGYELINTSQMCLKLI